MMDFKFTPFNDITLVILGLTLWVLIVRLRNNLASNWPMLYYGPLLLYWLAFGGALNPYGVFALIASGVSLRLNFFRGVSRKMVRGLEFAGLAYVVLRSVDLLAGGELSYYFFVGRPAS